ncbi:MAG: hypothetical protein KF872_04545 [Chitinophagales bacterium]|nr:hypothetical protein [Chitinophagales bacterium]
MIQRSIKNIFFLFLLILASCEKFPTKEPLPPGNNKKVWIINEGNFQFGNASLDVYLPDSQIIFKNVYKTANNKNLGDVAQSAIVREQKLFTIVNNSAKISVTNTEDYRELYSISLPASSPRYMLFINDTKAFVSELYAKKIWIINPANGTLIDTISTQGCTEQMVLLNNRIFVAQRTRLNDTYVANVLVLDATNHKILQTITLPSEPNSLTHINNTVYVLCSQENTTNAKLVCIDASNNSITKTLEFTANTKPILLRSNSATNELFWIAGDVFKMNANEQSLPSSPIIQGNNRNLYAMNVNPSNGEIYVADAIDYVQSSSVFRYQSNGTLLHTFKAGIITNNFIFE